MPQKIQVIIGAVLEPDPCVRVIFDQPLDQNAFEVDSPSAKVLIESLLKAVTVLDEALAADPTRAKSIFEEPSGKLQDVG